MAEAVLLKDLIIGDVISCTIYGSGVVPNIVNGKVLGFNAGDDLRDPAVAANNHANVYPTIPIDPLAPIPNDYTKYSYLRIRKPDNNVVEIGLPWVIENTLTRLSRQTATVVLSDFDSGDLNALKELLTINGFTILTINVN